MTTIPADFPNECPALTGVHPKVGVTLESNLYVTGRHKRYDACEDLAQQLSAYCMRKAAENPAWTLEFNFERTARGLAGKVASRQWDLSESEQGWVMNRVGAMVGGLAG